MQSIARLKGSAARVVGRRDRWRWPRRRLPCLNLALQGGGAHGAFTWGVLDRLLEEEDFRFEGLSGTSAGALNAVSLAAGWLDGGRDGARQRLAMLWHELAGLSRLAPLRQGRLPQMALGLAAQLLSPYQLNPLGINPLRDLLERLVDLDRLARAKCLPIVLGATNLRTGEPVIFSGASLSIDAVLASACLPQMSQAVEIGGMVLWDGGYTTNPPLVALAERCRSPDLLVVQINPLASPDLPRSAAEIRNRIDEIVFGRPLAAELGLLRTARRAAWRAWLQPCRRARRIARHRLHLIDGSAELAGLDPITKIVPDRPTIAMLRERGRAAANLWLGGMRSTRRAAVLRRLRSRGKARPAAA